MTKEEILETIQSGDFDGTEFAEIAGMALTAALDGGDVEIDEAPLWPYRNVTEFFVSGHISGERQPFY